ncbi:hypothetical protein GM3708_2622 [Geminocystis sp. NIES-3708]|uniref:hypothetical protein n=1 Tax=Geminocystis sp. NIES-3708 TaxID=1615909 RepID=UPI0005FC7EAC|nr:hypothetical protein [Geminocystis sp. NIES-3708]BAQ62216.1 hypothetical protein GM3708_2622 [Geminocystis sp. NIES-3708]
MNKNEILTLQNRSNKNIWITGILTFFVAPFGYIYTIRYKAAFIAFIVYAILLGLSEESETGEMLLGLFAIGVTVENVMFINSAKNQVKKLGININKDNFLSSSGSLVNPDIIILKVLQKRGIMTISEIVVATELSPQIVKQTLLELEREQLIYGYNRETDGAVVYKNI